MALSIPLALASAGAGLMGFSLISGRKVVVGNTGPMWVKKVGDTPEARANGISDQYMKPAAADAFNAMALSAAREGITLLPGSAFRSVGEQAILYAQYVARLFGPPTVALPGKSNHGNGSAVDVADAPGRSLTPGSAAFRWLRANAAAFGFSWDEGSKVSEPWHWRFTG